MRVRMSMSLFLLITGVGLFVSAHDAAAANAVAKIASFKGEVIILSEKGFKGVAAPGQELFSGELVQTKDGAANVLFTDGALLEVRPYTSIQIHEQEEESGFLFKTKSLVRRLTLQVGTLLFKSGSSNKKNFLQSPTAVCGLRGTEMKFGFDNVNTYLQQIQGAAETLGPVVQGFFNDLGRNPAMNNTVFTKVSSAYEADQKAQTTGAVVDQATARVATLDAVKSSVEAILQNPNLSDQQKSLLNQVLQNVTNDLQNATDQLNAVTTTSGATTTTAGEETTTSAAATTTSSALTTTSIISESTTSRAEQTTTIALPTLPPTTMRPTTISTTTTTSIAPTTTTTSATTTTTTSRRSPF